MKSADAPPLIILNPAANRGHMKFYRELLRHHAMIGLGEYRETTRTGDAQGWAMKAAQEGRSIVIVGGDGSLNEVVSGILASGRKVPLGIIPAGSGNDFARHGLGLSHDPDHIIERAFHGQPLEVDAGVVNGRYFVNAFGVGLDANIAVAAEEMKKLPFMSGKRLYYTSILQQLLFGYQRCPWLTFSLDDGQTGHVVEQQFILMAISNGPTYGAGFRINPRAKYNDGYFDVCAIDRIPQLKALSLLTMAKRGEHTSLPVAHFYRVRKVHIECREPINATLDGETTCDTHFDVEILPGALLIRA